MPLPSAPFTATKVAQTKTCIVMGPVPRREGRAGSATPRRCEALCLPPPPPGYWKGPRPNPTQPMPLLLGGGVTPSPSHSKRQLPHPSNSNRGCNGFAPAASCPPNRVPNRHRPLGPPSFQAQPPPPPPTQPHLSSNPCLGRPQSSGAHSDLALASVRSAVIRRGLDLTGSDMGMRLVPTEL